MATTTIRQIQNYATQAGNAAYNAASTYGGQLATYSANQAALVAKREVTVKQVVYTIIAIVVLIWLISEYKKTNSFIHRLLGSGGNANGGNDNQYGGYDGGGVGAGVGASSFDNTPNENKTLARGVKGVNVQTLQTLLNGQGQSLTVDGNFGPATQSALMAVTGRTSITLAEFRVGNYSSGNTNTGGNSNTSGTDERTEILNLSGSEKIERAVTYIHETSASWSPATFSRGTNFIKKLPIGELQQVNTLFKSRFGDSLYNHYNDMWIFSISRNARADLIKYLKQKGLDS